MAISKPPHCTEVSAQTMGSFVFLTNVKALGRGTLAQSCFGKRWMWLWSQAAQEEKCGVGAWPKADVWASSVCGPGKSPEREGAFGWEAWPKQQGKLGTEKPSPVTWLLLCNTELCLSFVNKQSCLQNLPKPCTDFSSWLELPTSLWILGSLMSGKGTAGFCVDRQPSNILKTCI